MAEKKDFCEIRELFDEYETNAVRVSDFGIIVNGARVDYIHLTDKGDIQVWCGNPNTGKHACELVLDKSERRRVFEEILENI